MTPDLDAISIPERPPAAEGTSLDEEIAAIRTTYAEFDQRGLTRTLWAPFAPSEVAVRAQQLLVFSHLLREEGRLHLEGMRILDYGCSTGRHLRQFLDMGAAPEALVGLDLDEASLTRGRRLSPHLRLESTNGKTIDFPDASFDLVTQHFVFSAMPSAALRKQLAAEMLRVLRPGGLLYSWDMPHLSRPAGGPSVKLDVPALFPGLAVKVVDVAMSPRPGDTLRPVRFLTRFLRPILNRLAQPPTIQAAVIRKPTA